MSRYPSLPLFTDAYIADTAHLTNEEHGAYLRLLMFAWRTRDCSLPDDDTKLARMLGITAKKWAALKPTVMAFWTLQNNTWLQPRLTRERQFVEEKVEKRRAAGKQGGRPKSLENGATAKANGSLQESKPKAPTPTPTYLPSEATRATSDLDADYDRLTGEITAAFIEAGQIIPPHPGRARSWLANGFSAELIISVVRDGLARNPKISGLSYFDKILTDVAAVVPPPAKPAKAPISDETWIWAVERYKTAKHWSLGKHSPAPGEPGCTIPSHILEAHGYAKAAA